ncbi:MAG: four helix bundle protein [Gammaproteobacteria bacterium]
MDAFESLEVWKRSKQLAVEIYRSFKTCRDTGFKDQITRSALSVSSNIAEGYERNSRKQFIQFLRIAKGSSGELRSQLYISAEIGYLSRHQAGVYQEEARQISRMIQGLIKHNTSSLQ